MHLRHMLRHVRVIPINYSSIKMRSAIEGWRRRQSPSCLTAVASSAHSTWQRIMWVFPPCVFLTAVREGAKRSWRCILQYNDNDATLSAFGFGRHFLPRTAIEWSVALILNISDNRKQDKRQQKFHEYLVLCVGRHTVPSIHETFLVRRAGNIFARLFHGKHLLTRTILPFNSRSTRAYVLCCWGI